MLKFSKTLDVNFPRGWLKDRQRPLFEIDLQTTLPGFESASVELPKICSTSGTLPSVRSPSPPTTGPYENGPAVRSIHANLHPDRKQDEYRACYIAHSVKPRRLLTLVVESLHMEYSWGQWRLWFDGRNFEVAESAQNEQKPEPDFAFSTRQAFTKADPYDESDLAMGESQKSSRFQINKPFRALLHR
jgi:hypothetical protein